MNSRQTKNESGFLRDIPLFSCLEEKDIAMLESASRVKSYPKNAMIINEGMKPTACTLFWKGAPTL